MGIFPTMKNLSFTLFLNQPLIRLDEQPLAQLMHAVPIYHQIVNL